MSKKTTRKSPKKPQGGNKVPPGRYRNYVFTSFNENPPIFLEDVMTFLAYGEESCPTTGRKHWQSYVVWKEKKSYRSCSKWLLEVNEGKDCWRQHMFGSLKSNETYCSKENRYTKFGTLPSQGERNDLNEIKKMIFENNETVIDIGIRDPSLYHKYGRTMMFLEDAKINKSFRTELTTCDWIYGPTGTGKTRLAMKKCEGRSKFTWTNDGRWWDGYNGEDVVVIDDFRGEIQYNDLLKLIDRYEYKVPIRHRPPRQFISKHIIITSCSHPKDIYKYQVNKKDSINQLLRRINLVELL